MGEICNGNCFCDFRNISIDCIEKLYIFLNIIFCLHWYCFTFILLRLTIKLTLYNKEHLCLLYMSINLIIVVVIL